MSTNGLGNNSPSTVLKEGAEGELETLKAKWYEFNHSRLNEVYVLESKLPCSTSGRYKYKSICYNAPKKGWSKNTVCGAHMCCNGASKDKMKIVSIKLDHACSGATAATRIYYH